MGGKEAGIMVKVGEEEERQSCNRRDESVVA